MSLRAYLAGLFALCAVSSISAAQEPQESSQEGEVVFTEGAIVADQATEVTDKDIDRRLTDIYDALPAFGNIDVDVNDGVVRLSGEVTTRETITEAEALASRISGVVAVDNALTSDVSVDTRLGPAAERARQLAEEAIALLPLLALAFAIIIAFWLLGLFLGRQAWLWKRLAPNSLLASLFRMVIPLTFIVLGLVIALNILDAVAVLSAVLGAAGVLGLAVGFAVRDSIENFIASVMLSLRQPFRPKDFVDIDGREGHVVRLTSRATILMTPNGNHTRIPNAQVFKAVIINYSRNPERRFTFELGIDAEDDPKAAMESGIARLHKLDFILDDPAPRAWIVEVGDSNIVLTFAPWIDQTSTDFLKAKSAAIRAVKTTLEDEGFTLPEPIYRLRIDQIPAVLSEAAVTPSAPPSPQKPEPEPPRSNDVDDVSKDLTIEEKVTEDRQKTGAEGDLLSEEAPTEYGDEGKNTNGEER